MGRDRNKDNSNEVIETYVQRLLAWETPLTADTLKSLAEDAGLGPAEIAAVEAKAQDHLKRGQNYLDFDCLDEAVEELSQAAVLAPLNLDILRALSEAYAERYKQNHAAQDQTDGIATAKRWLKISPADTRAVTLIKSLEITRRTPKGISPRVITGIAVAVGLSIVAAIVYNSIPAKLSNHIVNTDISLPASTESGTNQSAGEATEAEVDIPIEFDYPGLTIEPRLSRLNNYESSSFYTFNGVVLNESDQEVDSVVLKVEYLDQSGNVITADSKEAVEDHTPPLRPGDLHGFELIEELDPSLASVRLSVTTIDQLPAAEVYAPPTPIVYTWAFTAPTHLSFVLASRSENVNTSYATHFDGNWIVTNSGDSAIRELKLQTDFYDVQNNIISTKETYVVIESYAPIFPGETMPIRIFEEVSEDYDRYEVTVLSAE